MPLAYDGVYQMLGVPVPASYLSGGFSIINKRTKMSFLERAQSLIAHWKFNYYMDQLLEQENKLFQVCTIFYRINFLFLASIHRFSSFARNFQKHDLLL